MRARKAIFISVTFVLACLLVAYVHNRYFSMQARLDAYVQVYEDSGLFSGAVLVAKEGKILLCKAYGMANVELDVSNKINTKFRLGSVTKQFTAMAVMQLQELGLLNVQDPLSKYLPDYPRGKSISLHNLLTHTSGIPNVTDFPEYDKEKIKVYTLEKLITLFKDEPLEFCPGERFAYSNSNYILLTSIIEKVSGKSYETFLKDHIFDVIKMKDTGYDGYRRIIKNRAAGYSVRADEKVNAEYIDMSFPVGSGALYSTVEDLYKWDQALYKDTLASKKALASLFTPYKDNYGYGWFVMQSPHGKNIVHPGGIEGFGAIISRFVDYNVCVIVLSNFQNAPIVEIAGNLTHIIFGEKPCHYPKKHVLMTMSPEKYINYIGTYKGTSEGKQFLFAITIEQNKLFGKLNEQDKVALYPESETEFFCKMLDAHISFRKDGAGKVIELLLHQNGQPDIIAQKNE